MVVGDAAWRSPGSDGIGYGWALNQLTDPAARSDASPASLLHWLDHDYPGQVDDALSALRALSAVAVVGHRLELIDLRSSKDVDDGHRLVPEEEAALRTLLDPKPAWIAT
ncbi:MAG: hypothetical protein ACRDX9_15765 [Acidimicrobiia bacterium]